MPSFISRAKNAWNAFMNKDPTFWFSRQASISTIKPDRIQLGFGNDRNLIAAVYNRIAVDCSECDVRHVLLDENDRYLETLDTPLNNCFKLAANLDQTGVMLVQDAVLTMLDEGSVAVVPTDTLGDPNDGDSYKILELRVGKVTEWMPRYVKLHVYDENSGQKKDVVVKKEITSISENPFYPVMNECNSFAKRISRKLALLDYIDEHNGAGKMDLIIQLPYVAKTNAQMELAKQKREDIEMQLNSSKYGIAFLDGTDKITQLNRSVDNQLIGEINELYSMFLDELGMTKEILNGTADPQALNSYHHRIIVPIMKALTLPMKIKFLSKTAISQHQSIEFFNDPFKSIPVNQLAEIVDKFIRNEVATANEMRQFIGMKPAKDARADELRNPNISASKEEDHIDIDGNHLGIQ